MSRVATLLLIAATTCSVVGCRGTGQPQLFGPGSAESQQHAAQKFDPYPDTNIGPSVTGGRPDAYTAPAPEAVRGSPNNRWAMPWFGR